MDHITLRRNPQHGPDAHTIIRFFSEGIPLLYNINYDRALFTASKKKKIKKLKQKW